MYNNIITTFTMTTTKKITIHNKSLLFLLLLLLLYTPLFSHASLFGLFSNPTISQGKIYFLFTNLYYLSI